MNKIIVEYVEKLCDKLEELQIYCGTVLNFFEVSIESELGCLIFNNRRSCRNHCLRYIKFNVVNIMFDHVG